MTRTAAVVLVLLSAAARADDAAVAHGPLAPADGVSVAGVVRAAAGGPVKVTLTRRAYTSPHGWSWGEQAALTAKDGQSFRFDGLTPGDFDLCAGGDGLGPIERLHVAAYRDVEGLDLRLDKECRVVVRAKLGFEGELKHAWLGVSRPIGERDGVNVGYAASKDGVLDMQHLAPGRYWVTAEHFGERGRFSPSATQRSTSFLAELAPGDKEFDVTIPETVDVRLVVRSGRDGERIEGQVRCRGRAPWDVHEFFRTADGKAFDGMRSMGHGLHWTGFGRDVPLRGFSKGAFDVVLEALGFAPWEKRVEVEGPVRIDAELTPLPGRYVTLRDPVDHRDALYVDVRPAAGGPWRSLFVEDVRGAPTHQGERLTRRAFLAPGRYLVSATRPELAASEPVAIEVTDDRSTMELAFERPPGRLLSARTKTKSGASVDGFIVHVLLKDGAQWRLLGAKSVVAKDGGFEVRGLSRGTYRLAFDEAGAFPFGEVEIEGADVVGKEFVVCGKE
jgi:hypothetical protein